MAPGRDVGSDPKCGFEHTKEGLIQRMERESLPGTA